MKIYDSIFSPLVINILRYLLFAGVPFLIFYLIYPKFFRNNKIQSRLANNKDFIRELWQSLQTTIIIALVAFVIVRTPLMEYSQIYTDIHAYPLWWLGVSLLLALMTHDTYFYWVHRAMHHPKLFKRVHLIHHRSTNPSPWASYSFHIFEAIVEAMIAPIILFTIPLHPIAIIIFSTSSFVFNVYGHLGYEIAPKWFRYSIFFEIFNTSVHHNLHHHKFKGNYGYYFRFWDRIMGTENPDYLKEYDLIQEKRFGKAKSKPSFHIKKTAFLLLLMSALGLSAALGQNSIEGKWKDDTENGYFEITKVDGKYYGRLIGTDDPEENEKIRNSKAIFVINDFVQEGENSFCCGTLYLPRFDLALDGNIEMLDDKTLKIYGSYGFISSTRIWKRL